MKPKTELPPIEPDRVFIHELLPTGSFLNTRIGAEYTVQAGRTKEETIDAAYNFIHETHRRKYPAMYLDNSASYMGDENLPVVQRNGFQAASEVEDLEFLNVMEHLKAIKYREDAQAYIETTDYKMTLAAKKEIHSKPNKPE